MVVEQLGDVQQEVVEVDGRRGEHPLLVARIDFGHHVAQRAARLGLVAVGRDQLVLRPGDRLGQPVGREVERLDVVGFDHPLDGLPGVVRVVDREIGREADELGILPQQPGPEAVKRAQPDPHPRRELGHAPLHLVGRLVGEGEGQNLRRPDAVREQVGDAVGDDAGLAAARPGEHQQRPVAVEHGLALRFGEMIEEWIHTSSIIPHRCRFVHPHLVRCPDRAC